MKIYVLIYNGYNLINVIDSYLFFVVSLFRFWYQSITLNYKQLLRMKKILLLLISATLYLSSFGQDFTFHMTFRDAVGNSDTIYFGYDPSATDSVDGEFGENNIIDIPYDSIFDVRISNEFVNRWYVGEKSELFHLKKQIVSKNCPGYATPIAIDIKCKNWPVTATWDSTIWKENCIAGSLITGMPQGYWWDVTGPSDLYYYLLAATDSITFTSNYDANYSNTGGIGATAYIISESDSIAVYWLVFSDPSLWESVGVDAIHHSHQISVYPNPSTGVYTFMASSNTTIEEIRIYNLNGMQIFIQTKNETIDLNNKPNGVYYYIANLQNGARLTGKLIKY